MSIIYPGNYVAQLNAYRGQGVQAVPGVEFYKVIGALVLNPDNKGVLNTDGELAAGTYDLEILSPDLRQDDKPRKDKPCIIPTGATVYRTAVSAPGVKGVATKTVVIAPSGGGAKFPTTPSLVAAADGYYPADGVSSALGDMLTENALTAPAQVQITTNDVNVASLDPSAGACRNSPSCILVEIDYFVAAPAPDAEDANVPYATEAGSGT